MPRLFRRKVLLFRVPLPCTLDHPRSSRRCDLPCAIGAARVHHHNFVAAGEACDGLANPVFFVEGDDSRRDFHAHAITESNAEPQAYTCL